MTAEFSPLQTEAFCRHFVQEKLCAPGEVTLNECCAASNIAVERGVIMMNDLTTQVRIEELKAEMYDVLKISPNRTLVEVNRLAMSSLKDVQNEWGGILPPAMMDDDVAATVKKYKVIDGKFGSSTEIELHDKKGSLDMLMKHFNQYEAHKQAGSSDIHVTISDKDAQL